MPHMPDPLAPTPALGPPGVPNAALFNTSAGPDFHLQDYLQILWRRRRIFVQMFVLVLGVGIVSTLMRRPVYRAAARLMVPANYLGARIDINDGSNPVGPLLGSVSPEDVDAQVQVLRSRPFQEQALKRAGSRSAGVAFRIESEMGSNTMVLSAEGEHPAGCATAVNALLDLHQDRARERQTGGLQTTLTFLRKQVTTAEQELRAAESRLQTFRAVNQVEDRTRKQELQSQEAREAHAGIEELRRTVTATAARVNSLRVRIPKIPRWLTQTEEVPDPDRSEARRQLDAARQKFEEVRKEFQEDSPECIAAAAAVSEAEQKWKAIPSVRKASRQVPNPERSTLESRLTSLETDLEGYESALRTAESRLVAGVAGPARNSTLESQLSRLMMERDTALDNFRQLRKHFRDLQIRAQIPPMMTQVLERATVPTGALNRGQVQSIFMFAVLAVLFGCGLVLLQEHMDDRVNSPDDVERIARLPSLGHVPLLDPGASPLFVDFPANSPVAESYRVLRASIDFAGVDGPLRRLLVTSATKGEGKSVTSVNLALAMAMNGRRVVLIDADLRRPSIHRILQLSQEHGLSQVLTGQLSLGDVLQPTGTENLQVICSGPIPHNPAELLGSNRFDHVLMQLEEIADIVILDSPPCLPVTDPLLIASRADGVVLVLHAGQTRRSAVRQVHLLLQRARARVLGVILNRVERSQSGDYYYSRSYYGYGYGYAELGPGSQRPRGRRSRPARQPNSAGHPQEHI